AIHGEGGARLRGHEIEDVDIVQQRLGDGDKYWDGAVNLEQRVQFDTALASAELGPGKERQTKIDGGSIERIGGGVEFQTQVGTDVQGPRNLNQTLGEVGIDSPVASLVGIGQRRTPDGTTKAIMIVLATLGVQTRCDVGQ